MLLASPASPLPIRDPQASSKHQPMPPSEPWHGKSAAHLRQCLVVEGPLLRAPGAAASRQTRLSMPARSRGPSWPCPAQGCCLLKKGPLRTWSPRTQLHCSGTPARCQVGVLSAFPTPPLAARQPRAAGAQGHLPKDTEQLGSRDQLRQSCDRVIRGPSRSLTSASPAERGFLPCPRGGPRQCPHPAGDQARG